MCITNALLTDMLYILPTCNTASGFLVFYGLAAKLIQNNKNQILTDSPHKMWDLREIKDIFWYTFIPSYDIKYWKE